MGVGLASRYAICPALVEATELRMNHEHKGAR